MLKLLIKTSNMCNLNCTYCYNKPHSHESKTIDIETIYKIRQLAELEKDKIIVIWHGGEPLLTEYEFYEKAVEILKPVTYEFGMQTNGTLLTKDMYEKLKKLNINVSISHDGLNQNKTRGMNNIIENNIKEIFKTKQYKYEIGLINVINNDTFADMINNYNYFKQLGFKNLQYNKVIDEKSNIDKINEYIETYTKLFDMWLEDDDPIIIRNFYERTMNIIGVSRYMCSYGKHCVTEWLGIEPDGSIYPCDKYYDKTFCYGNIKKIDSFSEIKNTKQYKKIIEIKKEKENTCKNSGCEIYDFCYGGCLNRYINRNESIAGTALCKIEKMEFAYLYNKLNSIDIYKIKNKIFANMLINYGFRNIDMIKGVLQTYE